MMVQGRFVCHVPALYMMVLYDRARVGPTTKTSDEIAIICLFWLILQANPCFVLSCGIRVASMSSVDSIPSPNGVLILRCGYQSFLIIKIVLSILFNRRVSLLVDPIFSTSARSITSSFNGVHFFCPKPSLFSHPPTLFIQGFGFLNQLSCD